MKAPNFMCIGAAKSGTTTLYDILKQHDDIYLPSYKEPHFFDVDHNYQEGLDYYLKEYYSDWYNERVGGEFTPSYLLFPKCAERIRQSFGENMKFVIILRNPVDRAYSQYLHARRDMIEENSFEEALEQEGERLRRFVRQQDDISYIRFSYVAGGKYYEMIERYMRHFKPEQFRINLFEDEFLCRRGEMVADICSFIGVAPMELEVNLKSNAAAETRFAFIKRMMNNKGPLRDFLKRLIRSRELRSRIKYFLQKVSNKTTENEGLDSQTKERLMQKYFINDVKNLERLLERDLSLWYHPKQ